jgi:hypothetical protein
VLRNLLLPGFPHFLLEKGLFEDDDHSWRRIEFVLLMNVEYCYKQTQPKVKDLSNHLVDNLQYNEGIALRFDSLSLFFHHFMDDTL